ncbi:GNAT family N-acetyltransferase [Actinopolymorpha sp. B17G11]|uniref:GNAT family N-acetyltransferase n=1 Tax=Actinopolymorpha sp. B17G11 TaxID=3160861 RepID=UPI0032E50EF3
MDEVNQDLSPASMIHAIEDNAAELLLDMGRIGGGEQRVDAALTWTIGGSPIDYHNCVVRADLDPAGADTAIAESVRAMRDHGVPGTWHVGPSMRPSDLGDRLLAAGFEAGAEAGMAADLHALLEDLSTPDGLEIARVTDRATLARWKDTLAQGFGEGESEAAWVAQVYARIGFGDDVPYRHYLAYLDGEPVGTSTLFLGAGVAGIYFVMAVPAVRRQGIGAAVTLAALRDARALGYRIGVLGSSKAGHSVYARLGFQDYCEIRVYEWAPPQA